MSDPDSIEETARERECFERALSTALASDEVTEALKRFPGQNQPDLRSDIENGRPDIWARVARAHGRVRELEARRSALERRIAETDPGVRAASDPVENELIRLSNTWAALSPEADRLGLRPQGYDPATALAEIGRRLGSATSGARTFTPLEPGQPSPGNADTASGRAWTRRLQERLTRRQLQVGLTLLERDITSLEAGLGDEEAAITEALTIAAQGNREYGTLTNELEEAWQRLEEQLLNDGILDALRLALNDSLEDLYTVSMPVVDAPALSEPLAADKPVRTPAIATVQRLLDHMRGASIGVAGPRGAGKSTLIDACCATAAMPGAATSQSQSHQEKPWLGLRVSAPVEYEPRDFILYLFAELCRKLAPGAESELQPPPVTPPAHPRRFLRLCVAATAVAGGVAAGWGTTLVVASLRSHASLARPVSGILAGILVFITLAILYARGEIIRIAPDSLSPQYYQSFEAADQVERLKYSHYVAFRRRRQLWRRSAGLITLSIGTIFAFLAVWRLPSHPSSYVLGTAAIAVSGPIWFTALSLQSALAMEAPQDADTFILEYVRSGGDLRRLLGWQAAGLSVMCAIFGFAAIGLSFTVSDWSLSLLAGLFTVLVGGLALCAPLIMVGERLYPSLPPYPSFETSGRQEEARLENLAIESLIAIRFQQTISSDWSGSVSVGGVGGVNLPIALQSQWSRGASWARQPQTYPELVGRFREFAESIAQRYRVVIGIDELDKLESGVKAKQFLNDIKGIFGVRGCYFLVSVSEDAAAAARPPRAAVPRRL